MTSDALQQQLQAGITALKNGDRAHARQLLLEVVAADERQERAWLWLSGAVDTAEEKRICLENVLTINPENEQARRNLDRLTAVGTQTTTTVSQRKPLSPASAVLHPDRYEPVIETRTVVAPVPAADTGFQAESAYDDVWSREEDICAYCAHPIDAFTDQCPGCDRNLIRRRFRYAKPSPNLHLFWVMLGGIGQLFLVRMLFLFIVQQNMLPVVVNGSLLVLFLGLALGVYLRQSWALYGSYVALSALLVMAFTQLATPLDLSALGLFVFDEAISNVSSSLVVGFNQFLTIFLIAAAAIGLLLAIFSVSADFERVRFKQLATLRGRLSTASDYSLTARRLARADMWASAILHWQRAAAKAPGQSTHLEALGKAYAHLGFYERALDVLKSAQKLVSHPDRLHEINATMTAVLAKQKSAQ